MEQIQKEVLKKLLQLGAIGAHHVQEETVLHGFKRHMQGDVKTALKKLARDGYIVKIPHHPNGAYFIHLEWLKKIREILS